MSADEVNDETREFGEKVVEQARALNAAAERACAAWWGSFGGSDDPEGEWEGLDETERHYWRHVAAAVTPITPSLSPAAASTSEREQP